MDNTVIDVDRKLKLEVPETWIDIVFVERFLPNAEWHHRLKSGISSNMVDQSAGLRARPWIILEHDS